jgi:hypothetical protein
MNRIEIRNGRVFLVTELPPVEPRRRTKPMMTKKMARAAAVGKQLGAGPPQIVTKLHRLVRCVDTTKCGWLGYRLAKTAREKPCPHCGRRVQ